MATDRDRRHSYAEKGNKGKRRGQDRKVQLCGKGLALGQEQSAHSLEKFPDADDVATCIGGVAELIASFVGQKATVNDNIVEYIKTGRKLAERVMLVLHRGTGAGQRTPARSSWRKRGLRSREPWSPWQQTHQKLETNAPTTRCTTTPRRSP